MLLYRSCYPIRFNAQKNISFCARNSIGMNVRFYDVTVGELKTRSSGIDANKFDLWREIYYYEYVREQIVRNMSTFFIIILLLFINKCGN